ncbi:putative pyridoxal kinase C6F6.11c [Pseudocercospora fuligena]|uniref:pyridoxal kinase n=1 Tax=Pseudocercospora fuligena TaxID=685502 RepID=A0A8H6VJ29_9PEZI|nr:putative pyridoxal kinase C6F6.11c [Pseudocercospora fuligena]
MAESDVEELVPETHVLAIASHVTSGYVGNTMATFCMQTLGCEVSAIHTVNYSNHVAYRTFTGRKTTPSEVSDLYTGLKSALLHNFDVLLSGYCPSAALVHEVGKIGRDNKYRAATRPGSFFWILDPVMGDNGRIYVAEECVEAYKGLLKDADLILPNLFEAELLSGEKIRDLEGMGIAIGKLHGMFGVPNVVVTSIRLPRTGAATPVEGQEGSAMLSVIGSTATSQGKPRLFRITVPALPVFFSGTGDMFAALLVARLREAAKEAGVLQTASWKPEDSVPGPELPLAKAVSKVLASMHAVLKDTARHYEAVSKELGEAKVLNDGVGEAAEKDREMERHLKLTRAAEVRVVRNTRALREPPELEKFRAEAVDVDVSGDGGYEEPADELGVLKVAGGQGIPHQT